MTEFKTCIPSEMCESMFVKTFADVYEHSRWIAEQTFQLGLTSQDNIIVNMHSRMQNILENASHDKQLALIKAHPDLAGKAAIEGQLTKHSTGEQSSAGIDQCNAEEFSLFNQLNNDYKNKFGFPFIMAVKGSNKALILSAFQQRIDNSIEEEFKQALNEISKIALLRLNEL